MQQSQQRSNRASVDLLYVCLAAVAAALVQGFFGLPRNFAIEVLAQRIERDSRDELYSNQIGNSQTFHGRQKIGETMARATNDVSALNMMFSPWLMLIMDAVLALVVPIFLIGSLRYSLLLVGKLSPYRIPIRYNRAMKNQLSYLFQRQRWAGDVLGEGFAGFDREGGYTDRMIDGKTGVLPVDEAGGQSGVDELFVQEELDDQAAKVFRHV